MEQDFLKSRRARLQEGSASRREQSRLPTILEILRPSKSTKGLTQKTQSAMRISKILMSDSPMSQQDGTEAVTSDRQFFKRSLQQVRPPEIRRRCRLRALQ
jgi:hypothetical protein